MRPRRRWSSSDAGAGSAPRIGATDWSPRAGRRGAARLLVRLLLESPAAGSPRWRGLGVDAEDAHAAEPGFEVEDLLRPRPLRKAAMPKPRFELNPIACRWLRAPGRGSELAADDGPDWQTWLLSRMSRGQIADIGGVLVDRAVLAARFACVSDRCAPGPGRAARAVSCCADADVPLSCREERQLRAAAPQLQRFLRRGPASSEFFEGGTSLPSPGPRGGASSRPSTASGGSAAGCTPSRRRASSTAGRCSR